MIIPTAIGIAAADQPIEAAPRPPPLQVLGLVAGKNKENAKVKWDSLKYRKYIFEKREPLKYSGGISNSHIDFMQAAIDTQSTPQSSQLKRSIRHRSGAALQYSGG